MTSKVISLVFLIALSIYSCVVSESNSADLQNLEFNPFSVKRTDLGVERFRRMYNMYLDTVGLSPGGMDFVHLRDTLIESEQVVSFQQISSFNRNQPNPLGCHEICILNLDSISVHGILLSKIEVAELVQFDFSDFSRRATNDKLLKPLCFRIQFGHYYEQDSNASIDAAFAYLTLLLDKWHETRILIGKNIHTRQWNDLNPNEKGRIVNELLPLSIYLTNVNQYCSTSVYHILEGE